MSMSQEEIEALMNGLDINEDENQAEEPSDNSEVNVEEIEELISENTATEDEAISDIEEDDTSSLLNNSDIDDLLKDIELDNDISEEEPSAEIADSSIDDSLVNTEGIVETKEETVDVSNEDLVKDWTDSKINEGIFPLPAENDTKVVNQLSQVANDSEEKVSQIFDVLSLTLDNNNEIRTSLGQYNEFVDSQIKLLNNLSVKFPNIDLFKTHLDSAESVSSDMKEIVSKIGEEDMKIFEAMELMQFNDINRQKIERVMAVIRKLSAYLNNLFEDDGTSQEVAVAKHIHGDHNSDLMNDEDLDKLIAEFEK